VERLPGLSAVTLWLKKIKNFKLKSEENTMKTKLFFLTIIFYSTCLLSKAQVIHVPADQSTIQAGIDTASDGDTVLVADGTYLENINFTGKAIMVASHYIMDGDTNHINNTIIDGSQPANPDNGSVVTFITGEDTTSVLCGFTITGGSGMIDPVYGARIGGGITCYYATAKITHNKITGNVVSYSHSWGGGILSYNETDERWIVIENNTITGNLCKAPAGTAEGGGIEVAGHARICDNIISYNTCNSSTGTSDGGGIYHFSMFSPADTLILSNNIVSNNVLTTANIARGGGVFIYFSHCDVRENTIGYNSMTGNMTNGAGMLVREATFSKIASNSIHHNSVDSENIYWGVGLMFVNPAGPIYIEDNEFLSNNGPLDVTETGVGGGLAIMDAENDLVSVTNNIFKNNRGRFGGGFYSRSCYNLSVTNNFFGGNESNEGSAVGMYIPASTAITRPVFVNNTFTGNSAETRGGAAHLNCETNSPVFFNSIFYENSAPVGSEISLTGNSDPVVISYSDIDPDNISGNWIGEGNFNADPEFIPWDIMGHLSSTSPCINAGVESLAINGTIYYAPPVDYEGESRPDPVYDTIDIGADEYYGMPEVPVAMLPLEQGCDYFIAAWHTSDWAMGYYIDIAYVEEFTDMLPGFDDYDNGNDTSLLLENLDPGLLYFYRVRSYNGSGVSANSDTIDIDLCVGLEESMIQNSSASRRITIHCFPNPSQGITQFAVRSSQSNDVTLKIYDVHGREVAVVMDEKLQAGKHVRQFDLSGLPDGIYFVRAMAGKEWSVHKLILQK